MLTTPRALVWSEGGTPHLSRLTRQGYIGSLSARQCYEARKHARASTHSSGTRRDCFSLFSLFVSFFSFFFSFFSCSFYKALRGERMGNNEPANERMDVLRIRDSSGARMAMTAFSAAVREPHRLFSSFLAMSRCLSSILVYSSGLGTRSTSGSTSHTHTQFSILTNIYIVNCIVYNTYRKIH